MMLTLLYHLHEYWLEWIHSLLGSRVIYNLPSFCYFWCEDYCTYFLHLISWTNWILKFIGEDIDLGFECIEEMGHILLSCVVIL